SLSPHVPTVPIVLDDPVGSRLAHHIPFTSQLVILIFVVHKVSGGNGDRTSEVKGPVPIASEVQRGDSWQRESWQSAATSSRPTRTFSPRRPSRPWKPW